VRGVPVGVWLVGYGLGRLWIEGLRTEATPHVLGLRLNQVVAAACVAAGAALVAWRASAPRGRVVSTPSSSSSSPR
jgi:prolipoprotein diacylglyceryltransferase